MSLSALIEKVASIAPSLGGALGGPFGSVIGNLIAHVFGADPKNPQDILQKINADPDALVKLKQLELQNDVELKQIASLDFKQTVSDIEDARKQTKDSRLMGLMSVCILLGYVVLIGGSIYMCQHHQLSSTESIFLGHLMGNINSHFSSVVSFFFGKSNGENH